jgi:carbamoyl-phosphate synthase large subunit
VKEAVLPFDKFAGADTLLGPEMRSTGEVGAHFFTMMQPASRSRVALRPYSSWAFCRRQMLSACIAVPFEQVMGIDVTFGKAYAKAAIAAGQRLPQSGNVFITMMDKYKDAGEGAGQDESSVCSGN